VDLNHSFLISAAGSFNWALLIISSHIKNGAPKGVMLTWEKEEL
jgi:hypothetical protein